MSKSYIMLVRREMGYGLLSRAVEQPTMRTGVSVYNLMLCGYVEVTNK